MDDLKYWVAFHRISGLGPVRFTRLESRFGTLADAWRAPTRDLAAAAGLDSRTVREVDAKRPGIDPDIEMERLERLGVSAIHLRSPDYPPQLREIYDAPSVIYIKGALAPGDDRAVAIVGTRGPTTYGREMAWRLSHDLASAGVTIASGMARGVDGIAHQAALEAGGRTIAVMGGGLDSIYPAQHTQLARRIAASGAVVSEYPPGTRPLPQHFPRRNRVISGLTRGVLVVEAGMKSGAMLTVKWALDQDREVFAVPGNVVSETSAGTNWLIQQGARLVTAYSDVLEELNLAALGASVSIERQAAESGSLQSQLGVDSLAREENGLNNIESGLLGELRAAAGPVHIDELTRTVRQPASAVGAAMAVLELKGLVTQTGPMQFSAQRERARQAQTWK